MARLLYLYVYVALNPNYLKYDYARRCYVSPESKTWRTEVAGWETNKAPAQIRERVKANLSLFSVWKVAMGIKHTATHWFYQNDRPTKGLEPKTKGEVGVTDQGGKKLNSEFHSNRKHTKTDV